MKRPSRIAVLVCAVLWAGHPVAAQSAQEQLVVQQVSPLRSVLAAKLVDLGLTAQEAEARVNQLTDRDVQQLAENPQQMGLGGIKDKTLIIIALILILPSILLLAAL